MSQQQINPLEDWASEELSEAELEALAGGRTNDTNLLGDISFLSPPLLVPTDNIFTFDGQAGTTLAQDYSVRQAMNTSLSFP